MTNGHRYQAIALSWLAMFLGGCLTLLTGAALWVWLGVPTFVLVFLVCAITGHLEQVDAARREAHELANRRTHEQALALTQERTVKALAPQQIRDPRTVQWLNDLAETIMRRKS